MRTLISFIKSYHSLKG